MHVEDAKLDRGWLCLKTQPSDALKWLCKFKQGNYEIKKIRQKRSLDANAYLWVLLDKLSSELAAPKEELYRRYIREIGGVSQILCVLSINSERNGRAKGSAGRRTRSRSGRRDARE